MNLSKFKSTFIVGAIVALLILAMSAQAGTAVWTTGSNPKIVNMEQGLKLEFEYTISGAGTATSDPFTLQNWDGLIGSSYPVYSSYYATQENDSINFSAFLDGSMDGSNFGVIDSAGTALTAVSTMTHCTGMSLNGHKTSAYQMRFVTTAATGATTVVKFWIYIPYGKDEQ